MTDPARARTDSFKITTIEFVTKRAELVRLRKETAEVENDLMAIDRALALLGYEGDLEAVPPRRTQGAPFGRSQNARAVLNCRREAGEPLGVRQIAVKGFAEPVDRDNPVPLDNLCRRVSKALTRLKSDGTVRCERDGFGAVAWSLTP